MMIDSIFVAIVLAFLVGVAVGIAGYFFTTLASWEKEVEAIFQRMCERYQKKIDNLNAENDRLHESVLNLQIMLAKQRKQEKKGR